jgi:hypothetical protein
MNLSFTIFDEEGPLFEFGETEKYKHWEKAVKNLKSRIRNAKRKCEYDLAEKLEKQLREMERRK